MNWGWMKIGPLSTLCPSPSGLGCAPDEEWSCVFPVMIDLSGGRMNETERTADLISSILLTVRISIAARLFIPP